LKETVAYNLLKSVPCLM